MNKQRKAVYFVHTVDFKRYIVECLLRQFTCTTGHSASTSLILGARSSNKNTIPAHLYPQSNAYKKAFIYGG